MGEVISINTKLDRKNNENVSETNSLEDVIKENDLKHRKRMMDLLRESQAKAERLARRNSKDK